MEQNADIDEQSIAADLLNQDNTNINDYLDEIMSPQAE